MIIKKLIIENFKSHKSTDLDLGNLNILTGMNGVGKSSVFQSLLLLRQSFEKKILDKGLDLNHPHCEIGNIQDALHEFADSDFIQFRLQKDDNAILDWKFKAESNNLSKTFIPIMECNTQGIDDLNLFGDGFQYLSAARLSPRDFYPNDTYLVETKKQLSIDKGQAELTPHYLHYWGIDRKVKIANPGLKHSSIDSDSLIDQTSAWESEISPNVTVKPEPAGKSFTLKYTFSKQGDILPTSAYSAENVGFGLSYALPIIVAVLTANPGDLILIENPEAHLHPKGQSKLAQLLALAAQSDVQLFVETHSDHFINGIMVASKKYEKESQGIQKEKVSIYHFNRNEQSHSTEYTRINMLEDGKLDKQPMNFFDQVDTDLEYLLGF